MNALKTATECVEDQRREEARSRRIAMAADDIARTVRQNPALNALQLIAERNAGDIGGWMCLPSVTALTFAEWTEAMTHAVGLLLTQTQPA